MKIDFQLSRLSLHSKQPLYVYASSWIEI